MICAAALWAVVTLASGNDAVLLDFTATWCGPCRTMEPTVARLQGAGYPVRKVDIDAEPALAQQFRIRAVPTFVMIAGGREIGRIEGPASFEQLAQLVGQAGIARAQFAAAPNAAANHASQVGATQLTAAHAPATGMSPASPPFAPPAAAPRASMMVPVP